MPVFPFRIISCKSPRGRRKAQASIAYLEAIRHEGESSLNVKAIIRAGKEGQLCIATL